MVQKFSPKYPAHEHVGAAEVEAVRAELGLFCAALHENAPELECARGISLAVPREQERKCSEKFNTVRDCKEQNAVSDAQQSGIDQEF